MGHGVGLRACELPIIYRPDMMMVDAQLEEGMVICLEPETSVEVGGETVVVKVEDMYEVTAFGTKPSHHHRLHALLGRLEAEPGVSPSVPMRPVCRGRRGL